jgi:hypothetical protein
MISKTHILLFIFLIGFFFLPIQAEACGMKSEKKKHTTEKVQTKTTDDCCNSSTNKKGKEGCNDKCNHSNCRCVSIISVLTFEKWNENTLNCFNFSNKEESYYLHTADLSSGFYTIWSPPKIS